MFNPLYIVLSRADTTPKNSFAGLWLAVFSCITLGFNAAGQLHVGILGLIGIVVLFMLLGTIGCYWYIVSIHFLGERFSQIQDVVSPSRIVNQPWLTALQGLWPLILLGPTVSAGQWWPSLGLLMTFGIITGMGFTLIAAVRDAYHIHWLQATLCLLLTLIMGSLALGGLIGWPMMFLLGAKNFSIAMPI